jgi:hypothetical protein
MTSIISTALLSRELPTGIPSSERRATISRALSGTATAKIPLSPARGLRQPRFARRVHGRPLREFEVGSRGWFETWTASRSSTPISNRNADLESELLRMLEALDLKPIKEGTDEETDRLPSETERAQTSPISTFGESGKMRKFNAGASGPLAQLVRASAF